MSSDHQCQELLIKHLEDYATKADADYAAAANIFDARWTHATTVDLDRTIVKAIGRWTDLHTTTTNTSPHGVGEAPTERQQKEPKIETVVDMDEVHQLHLLGPEPPTVGNSAIEPPKYAEFCLALLLSKVAGEAIIGDLSERFDRDCQHFGPRRARQIYWGRTVRSLWPLVRRVAMRAIRWGVVVEYVRRYF